MTTQASLVSHPKKRAYSVWRMARGRRAYGKWLMARDSVVLVSCNRPSAISHTLFRAILSCYTPFAISSVLLRGTLHASRFTVFLLATALSLSLNLNQSHAAS